ncbi:hypothetical protein BKA66DRAFT_580219 [Pyrenochaeta sp. MPI-SDFR-AT-0127]|nr:hypothetical protein BKA66DRAFT_580219 [Pyrenochaeta sp. MPI-SDFR-AT-0127]
MSSSRARSSIVDFSTELLCLIIEHLPLSSHFDFALTCKTLSAASQHVLRRHQDAHKRFRVASDLDPSTAPLLLRSAFGLGDPILAWHVRSFEVWRDRTTWAEWKSFSLTIPLQIDADCEPSDEQVSLGCAKEDLEWYREYLEKDLNDEELERGFDEVGGGSDGLLKALLFAKCSRLQELKFVTKSQKAGSCLYWLRIMISNWSGERTRWPIGFFNLRHVAIGIYSRTWMDDYHFQPSTSLLAHILRLPNIDTIFFNGLRCPEDDDDANDDDDVNLWAEDTIPPRCSSVKHIFFDGPGTELSSDFREALFIAPRQLLTAAFRYSGPEGELWGASGIFGALAEFQGASLESLMWYDYDHHTIQGDHCSLSYTKEFANFQTLKQISFNIQDVELSAYHSQRSHREDGESLENYFVRFASEAFPDNMETLVLWDTPGSGHAGDNDGKSTLLERAIVKMVKDKRYKNLKAIFLEDVESTRGGPKKEALWFQEASAVGFAEGVDVHTLTSRASMKHSIKFPGPVDEYDLRTGLHSNGRPTDWVFNPYVGRWESPGCNSCGSCQRCHSEYDADLWEKNGQVSDTLDG